MMKMDLDKIRNRLFEKDSVRQRILRDFGISQDPADANAFAGLIIEALKQPVVADPLQQKLTNREVFQAAVRALGSNSRNWCDFLKQEKSICGLLEGYDPQATVQSFKRDAELVNRIASHLTGQTSGRDAENMVMWANILAKRSEFYTDIVRTAQKFRDTYRTSYRETLDDCDLALCLVGHYADKSCSGPFKFPGMSYALASEFSKNLGWSCFKPDRHIQRLFNRWFARTSATLIEHTKLERLESLIRAGRKSSELRSFLHFSMLGRATSPASSTLSQVDNLVWLLGKYVERKGRETSTVYVTAV
jgi:hypothetical protein